MLPTTEDNSTKHLRCQRKSCGAIVYQVSRRVVRYYAAVLRKNAIRAFLGAAGGWDSALLRSGEDESAVAVDRRFGESAPHLGSGSGGGGEGMKARPWAGKGESCRGLVSSVWMGVSPRML